VAKERDESQIHGRFPAIRQIPDPPPFLAQIDSREREACRLEWDRRGSLPKIKRGPMHIL